MRNLIYYVACIVDGFIARADGSFDCFLSEDEHFADLLACFPDTIPSHLREAFGMRAENQRFDVVLMGRKDLSYKDGFCYGSSLS